MLFFTTIHYIILHHTINIVLIHKDTHLSCFCISGWTTEHSQWKSDTPIMSCCLWSVSVIIYQLFFQTFLTPNEIGKKKKKQVPLKPQGENAWRASSHFWHLHYSSGRKFLASMRSRLIYMGDVYWNHIVTKLILHRHNNIKDWRNSNYPLPTYIVWLHSLLIT